MSYSVLAEVRQGNSLRHILWRAWLFDEEDANLLTFATGDESDSKTNPEETRVIGHTPLSSAFTKEAQSPTDKPAEPKDTADTRTAIGTVHPQALKVTALEDASRIQTAIQIIDLGKVGAKDARIIMSEEHKSLGYRPPPDSLAAKAQRSSLKHPDSSLGLDAATLRDAARADAERIK